MIDKLNITEFRGIKKCEKEIELSKFNVLVGRNNSGKTALLEAVYLCGGNQDVISSDGAPTITLQIIHLHSGKDGSLVYGYSGRAKIDYTVKNRFKIIQNIDENGNCHGNVVGGSSTQGWMDIAPIFGITADDYKNFHKEISTLFMFIPTNSEYIKMLISKIRREEYSNKIMKSGAHVRIIEFINKCVNDKFTDIYLPDLKLRKELSDNVLYIPLEDLGYGLFKVIPILLWIESFTPKILLWDDFETSAHPSLIKILIKYLSKKDIQVIISTHSIDVLSALLDSKPKDTSVLLLSKTRDDVLKYSKLNLDELETMMEDANHDPRLVSEALQL